MKIWISNIVIDMRRANVKELAMVPKAKKFTHKITNMSCD